MTLATDVSSLYRGRLATGKARLLAGVDALWAQSFNPADPSGSLPGFGTVLGRWVTGAQATAASEATSFLSAYLSAMTGVPPEMAVPFGVPSGLVGRVMNGSTVMDYCRQAPAVYFNRIGQGFSANDAAASTLSWANKTAGSEPYRVANATVTKNANADPRFTGRCKRSVRPHACEFCTLIADRGYIPSHAGFAAHPHCQCIPEPEISSYAMSRSAQYRGRKAFETAAMRQAMGLSSEPPSKPTNYLGIPLRNMGTSDPTSVLFGYEAEARTEAALRYNLGNIDPEIAKRLQYVRVGGDADFANIPSATAFFEPDKNGIVIRPAEYGTRATKDMRWLTENRWWTPDGAVETSSDRTLSHELGHFLDHQLAPNERYQVLIGLDEQYGLRTGDNAKSIVSNYAGTNDRELMAELWAEYKTSPSPRPPAQYLGRYVEDKLGPNPSPTPSLEELRAARLAAIDAQWRAGQAA